MQRSFVLHFVDVATMNTKL